MPHTASPLASTPWPAIGHPIRSVIHKPQIGESVVGWVTTSESSLLYVFFIFYIFFCGEWRLDNKALKVGETLVVPGSYEGLIKLESTLGSLWSYVKANCAVQMYRYGRRSDFDRLERKLRNEKDF
ncbi:hypothetical protein BDZ45DRAFT_645396 [Acephala macrosclerotiorum]|nr:hypothetical protein BDZ45DRAFT_645396 [Acephala macrosclerotiorum]